MATFPVVSTLLCVRFRFGLKCSGGYIQISANVQIQTDKISRAENPQIHLTFRSERLTSGLKKKNKTSIILC